MQQEEQQAPKFNIKPKDVVKYAMLPGLFPRLLRLSEHVSKFFFMFTQIFGAVGLIDRNHPCLRPENIGRYRFMDVVGLAATNVILDRKHLPQTVMFFVVVLSIVLTVLIFLAMIMSMLVYTGDAQAQYFGTPEDMGYTKNGDWALRFLFRIFGDTGMFGEAGPGGSGVGNPWFTAILVGMLKHYSLAMLVVAAFMILYILVITLTEAARSGQPFGTRFDSIWAPIRLALAIGLLIPIASPGYNGAQMLVFQSAVWGSNLATNVWYGGLNELKCKPASINDLSLNPSKCPNFLAAAMTDQGYKFTRDIFLVNLCVQGYRDLYSSRVNFTAVEFRGVVTYTFGPPLAPDLCGIVEVLAMPYDKLGFGAHNTLAKPQDLQSESWPAKTIRGYHEIAKAFLPIPPEDLVTRTGSHNNYNFGEANVREPMAKVVNGASHYILKRHKDEGFASVVTDASKMTPNAQAGSAAVMEWITLYRNSLGSTIEDDAFTPFFSRSDFVSVVDAYNAWLFENMTKDAQYGWTTAGVFYLRISSAMSTISQVVNNPPRVTRLPTNFSKAFATDDNPTANTDIIRDKCSNVFYEIYNNIFNDGLCKKYNIALEMNGFLEGGNSWFYGSVANDPDSYAMVGGQDYDRALFLPNPDTSINLDAGIILTPILDALQEATRIQSGDLHPIGSVIHWGNTFMTMAAFAYGIGILGLGGGLTSIAFMIGGFLMLPGFVLAFYVPMLPFLHFTFAVVEWMISILEAVIGMPLWALSLITLEGDGLGKGMDGVKRLFEIVLRPTIIVFSLMVSVIVFTASITFFNDAISLYGGAYNEGVNRNPFQAAAGGLGMIFIYMFGVYSLATSCFKLIDVIPDNFGRWIGLEGGFGAKIKGGVIEEMKGFIVGAAAFKFLSQTGSGIGGARKQIQADSKAAKGKKEADRKEAATEQRMRNLESRSNNSQGNNSQGNNSQNNP